MPEFIPIPSAVVADTIYVGDKLCARDVAVTLPEVTAVTAEVPAMGTMAIPIWQLIENLELAITKIGLDSGLRAMIKPDMGPIEIRGVQPVTLANGTTKNVGFKVFARGIPTKIPGISLAVGEASENECTFMLSRYNLFVDGEEMFLIDRLAGIVRIAGTDYTSEITSML